jgi:restriction system protein
MKNYYRVMLGKGSMFAAECIAGNFIGADYGIDQDLTGKLPGEWRAFNKEFIPVYLAKHPEKSKIGAGLACGALWTLAKGMQLGDVVFSPDGKGNYRVAEVTGGYSYAAGQNLCHRRMVQWFPTMIAGTTASLSLQSAGSAGAVSQINNQANEIEKFIAEGHSQVSIIMADGDVAEPPSVVFAMEQHLEEFLIKNWEQTELGKDFAVFQEDGELKGKQYPTDTGPIDILAVSKDSKRLLVIELKRGRASDKVVGQILRYMGYVKDEVAEPDQIVEGMIIALEDDKNLRRAITMVPFVSFFRYEVNFKLVKN